MDLEALSSKRVTKTPATLHHDSRTTEDEIQSHETKLSAALRNELDVMLQELDKRCENDSICKAALRQTLLINAVKALDAHKISVT